MNKLNSKIPEGPLETKWSKYKSTVRLVNPSNKRRIEVIVVGSGLAGAAAAATLAELGYTVKCFCFQDSPRRAHSIAAQIPCGFQKGSQSSWLGSRMPGRSMPQTSAPFRANPQTHRLSGSFSLGTSPNVTEIGNILSGYSSTQWAAIQAGAARSMSKKQNSKT